mgnify:CR=1 FL=1
MADNDQNNAQAEDDVKVMRPHKIYLKDASFESPNSPELFTLKWNPKLSVEISHSTSALEQDFHEVVLTLTCLLYTSDAADEYNPV